MPHEEISRVFALNLICHCPTMSASEDDRKVASNVLSAEELVRQGWHQNSSLPIRGVKDYAPDGSWIQDKRLEVTLRDRASYLEEERVAKLGSLARGEWKPDVKKIHLVKNKKKFWQTMGHSEDGIDYLYPEEAIFLLDAGMMEIYYGGLPLSLQQAFASLLGPHMTVEQYQVFAFLSRYGYILRRHNPNLFLTDYERQLKIDQYSKIRPKKKKKNRKRSADETTTTNQPEDDDSRLEKRLKEDNGDVGVAVKAVSIEASKDGSMDFEGLKSLEKDKSLSLGNGTSCSAGGADSAWSSEKTVQMNAGNKESCPQGDRVTPRRDELSPSLSDKQTSSMKQTESLDKLDDRVLSPEARVSEETCSGDNDGEVDTKPTSSIAYTEWDWTKVSLPNMANQSNLVVEKPNLDLLPCCVLYDQDSYTFDLDMFKRHKRAEKNWEFSLGGTSWKRNIQAKNWGEYRRKYNKHLTEYSLETSPAGHLWRGDVVPLVRPQDGRSMRTILQKLQIIESVQLTLPKYRLESQHSDEEFRVLFDVYLPNSNFKKTLGTLPHHHLCVVKSSDRLPSHGETLRLARSCHSRAPLHFAVVDEGDMNFYIFHDIELPTDL